MITPDEFEVWKESPVTQMIFAELKRKTAENRETFAKLAFAAGTVDHDTLTEMIVRERTWAEFMENGLEDWSVEEE